MCTPRNYSFITKYRQIAFYDLLNEWVTCYFQIQAMTEQLLIDYYNENQTLEKKDVFPIPVKDIAQWLGFEIRRKPLNSTRNANLGMVWGRLEKADSRQWIIFLEERHNLTYEQERYAIANLLGQYYVGRNAEFAECAEVRLPSDNSEIMSTLFTTFLIFPPQCFFKAADEYADLEKRPISQELMLMALSKKAEIPYYYTVVGYEHLKILASYAKMQDFEQKLNDVKKRQQENDKVLIDDAKLLEIDNNVPRLEVPTQLAPETFFY